MNKNIYPLLSKKYYKLEYTQLGLRTHGFLTDFVQRVSYTLFLRWSIEDTMWKNGLRFLSIRSYIFQMKGLWRSFICSFLLHYICRLNSVHFIAHSFCPFWPRTASSARWFRHGPGTTTRSSFRRRTTRFSSCNFHLRYWSFSPAPIRMFTVVSRIRMTLRTRFFLRSRSSRSRPHSSVGSWSRSSSSSFRTGSTPALSSTTRSRSRPQFRLWTWFRPRFAAWYRSRFRARPRSWSWSWPRSWLWPRSRPRSRYWSRSRSRSAERSFTTTWPWASVVERMIVLAY